MIDDYKRYGQPCQINGMKRDAKTKRVTLSTYPTMVKPQPPVFSLDLSVLLFLEKKQTSNPYSFCSPLFFYTEPSLPLFELSLMATQNIRPKEVCSLLFPLYARNCLKPLKTNPKPHPVLPFSFLLQTKKNSL